MPRARQAGHLICRLSGATRRCTSRQPTATLQWCGCSWSARTRCAATRCVRDRALLQRHGTTPPDGVCAQLGNTPIHLAVLGRRRYSGAFATRDGHLDCLEELLLAWHLPLGGVNAANAAGDTALHLAAQAGDEAVVRMLYEYSQCMPEIKNKARARSKRAWLLCYAG